MPSPYVDLINAVSTEFEFYDQSTADLISDALERSLVWTVRAGWRPFSRRGLYVDAGYSTINLGGRATSDDVLSAYLSGQRLPTIPALASDMPYDIDATLQMARVEAGWVVWLSDLYLRIAVGGAFTMASNTVIDPGQSGSAQVDSSRQTIATKAGQYLDDTFTTYVHTGTLTLTLGYRVLGPRQK
ncbi:MAG: hypothetical protein MJE77_41130 [Proteobacteria bacterium]|nr:hypothetical protein [Pseudomonadota bacterium]